MTTADALVVYDVGNDRRRSALYAALRRTGTWVQRSTWTVPLKGGLSAQRLVEVLAPLLRPGDRLRAYQPCGRCRERALWVPSASASPPRRATVVVPLSRDRAR